MKKNLLILFCLVGWIILTPSLYQKGGVDSIYYCIIPLFIFISSPLITFGFNNFKLLETFLVSTLFSFVVLFLTTFITLLVVEIFYGDKTWFLWETKHRIIINTVYYGLNIGLLFLFNRIYIFLRKELAKEKRSQ